MAYLQIAHLLLTVVLVVSVRGDGGSSADVLFRAADTNHDDRLTRTELDNIFLMFDVNNDTQITPPEMVQNWVQKYNLGGPQQANSLFTKADVNDDGVIDYKDIPGIYTYFDQDGNGYVDISEFLTQWDVMDTDPEGLTNVSVDITG